MIKQVLLMMGLGWAGLAGSETIVINGMPVDITSVNANGTGCAPNTVMVGATQDNTQISILFGNYIATTDSNLQVATADCNIAVGLAVEPGFSVGIIGIDWRGSVVVAPGSRINFHREFFFAGSQGPVSDTSWADSGLENFFLEDDPAFVIYSSCAGKPLIARADTSATVIGPNSLFSLRSADVSARLLYTLSVKPC